jgi:hypothetical protein
MLVGEYHEYVPWDDGHCFHPAEVRALTERANELQQLGVSRSVGDIALNSTDLSDRCTALRRTMGKSQECPLKHELDRLAAFVSKPENIALLDKHTVELGRSRRPVELTPEQEVLAQIVDVAAQDAYFTYSRVSGISSENARRLGGSCWRASFVLQQRLRELGIDSQSRRYSRGGFGHFFLRLDTPDGPMYACPTWQQFLPEGSNYDELPHTLIAPVSQVTEVAKSLGVPEEWATVWADSKEDKTPWWHFSALDINRLVETEGYYEQAEPMPPHISKMLETARQLGGEDAILHAIQRAIDTMRVKQ